MIMTHEADNVWSDVIMRLRLASKLVRAHDVPRQDGHVIKTHAASMTYIYMRWKFPVKSRTSVARTTASAISPIRACIRMSSLL